mmetsp:Transcript_151634/g.279566  ORF Transcript_151634/g.279566 Transcript_151634/m.279566 type:complete len:124 (+) Transcript_151634:71-442(+)
MATSHKENSKRFLQATGLKVEHLGRSEGSTMQVNCTKVAASTHPKNTSRSRDRNSERSLQPRHRFRERTQPRRRRIHSAGWEATAGHHIVCAERQYFRKLKKLHDSGHHRTVLKTSAVKNDCN